MFLILMSGNTIFSQIAPIKRWDKTFGANAQDSPSELRVAANGDYLIGGWSRSGLNGDKTQASKGFLDFWLVLTDNSGNKIWDKTIGGNDEDVLNDMQKTTDGGYILAGNSRSGISSDKSEPSQGSHDYWVVKIDASGNKLWDKTYGSNGLDMLYAVQQTSDGGYIFGGYSPGNISGDKTQASRGGDDYWIVKVDAFGSKQWDKTFGGSSNETLTSLIQTSDGGYLLGGYSYSGASGDKSQVSKGSSDFWIIKLNANGAKVWDKSFGGSNTETWVDLLETSTGEFLVGGTSMSGIGGDKTQANQGNYDYWLIKLNPQGGKIWDKTYGGNGWDEMTTIYQAPNGDYIIGGLSESGNSGDKSQISNGGKDFWLLRLNSLGNKIWDASFGAALNDIPFSMQPTSDGGYIIAGESDSGISGDKSQGSMGMSDFWLLKLGPDLLGIEDELNDYLRLYPNPTSGIVKLELKQKEATQVSIYNSLGKVIFTRNLFKTVGENLLYLDLSKEPKGIYTIQIVSENQVNSKKLVLQ